MFDNKKLEKIISAYKDYFPKHWEDEKYKWEAIEHFRKYWDIDADNFADMFTSATSKTLNLLANMNNYPKGMMKAFAEADEKTARDMFRNLYDESQSLTDRIDRFQMTAEELRVKYDDGNWKQHFQSLLPRQLNLATFNAE